MKCCNPYDHELTQTGPTSWRCTEDDCVFNCDSSYAVMVFKEQRSQAREQVGELREKLYPLTTERERQK